MCGCATRNSMRMSMSWSLRVRCRPTSELPQRRTGAAMKVQVTVATKGQVTVATKGQATATKGQAGAAAVRAATTTATRAAAPAASPTTQRVVGNSHAPHGPSHGNGRTDRSI